MDRFRIAFESSQAMAFMNHISLQKNENKEIIKWLGRFTTIGFINSPYYEVTSFFDENGKIVKQIFQQVEKKTEEEQVAP